MDIHDPMAHVEFKVIDLVLEVNHLVVFFLDKHTDFLEIELYLSHLLDPQGNVINVGNELLRTFG